MASIPTQEEILAATRKSQEAMIAAIKNWFETVRTVTPKLTSVYAPLTERLPKLPPVSLPFTDKLPTPEEAVGNAYHMAEQLLASQRRFTEDLLEAMTPLIPARAQAAPEDNGSNEPKVPSHRVWQEAVSASEAKPAVTSEAKPAVTSEAKPVTPTEVKPAVESAPTVASASAEPKAAAHPAAKSTPARTAPRSTGATRSTGAARSTAAKSGAAKTAASKSSATKSSATKSSATKSTAGTDTPKRTSANPAPKGPDAH